jgi:hypothetical protein
LKFYGFLCKVSIQAQSKNGSNSVPKGTIYNFYAHFNLKITPSSEKSIMISRYLVTLTTQ